MSGWFRDDQTLQISYRPDGHADDCLKTWIELATLVASESTQREEHGLYKKLLSQTSVGLCRTCHTVDQISSNDLIVNWTPNLRDPSVRAFTKFVHGPHLIQPSLQNCTHCHQLDAQASNKATFLTTDWTQTTSNFAPITKSNCTSCHGKNKTHGGCTQCHNYHVGSKVTGMK